MSLLYPFLINDKLYIKLNEDINSFDPRTTELEFRIGYIDEKSSFVPGIYESQYNNILNTLNEYYKVTNDSSLKIESIKTLEDLRPIRIHINKARSEKIINKFYGKDPTKEFVWYP